MKKDKIFIQIVSYRDNQLLPTIKNCIENAHCPENLVFCIAWQHSTEDEWDTLDECQNDIRFKIIDINYRDSEGVCWARNKIQQYYDNEDINGNSLYRQDVPKDEIKSIKDQTDNFYKIWRTFNFGTTKPYKYIVWPYSEKHGWCARIEDIIYKPNE